MQGGDDFGCLIAKIGHRRASDRPFDVRFRREYRRDSFGRFAVLHSRGLFSVMGLVSVSLFRRKEFFYVKVGVSHRAWELKLDFLLITLNMV
jgi:hypothetical protein